MPGADRLADHHLGAQLTEQVKVEARLAAVDIKIRALHPGQHRPGVEGHHPSPAVENPLVAEAGQPLGGVLGAVRVIGGQVGGAQEQLQRLADVLALSHQMVEGSVMVGVPSGDVAGRVKAGDRPDQVGMAGGGRDNHLSSHALSDQDGLLQAQLADELGHVVAVLFHDVDLVWYVAFAVAAQVDGDAPVIRGKVLLLEAEPAPIAEAAVDEDDGRVAGAHLVVGETDPVGGGYPFSHATQLRFSCLTGKPAEQVSAFGSERDACLVFRVWSYLSGRVYWNTPPVRFISAAMASACWMKRLSMALTWSGTS